MCPSCLEEQSRKQYDQLQKVGKEATEAARAAGYGTVYIIRTANGIIGYRFPGDESLTRLTTVDILVIT